jgi:CRP/FNR family transcriptional regulator, cyclic AMP receptor protein
MATTHRATIGRESGNAADQNRVTGPSPVWGTSRDGIHSGTTVTASAAKRAVSSSAPRSASARVCHVLAEDPDLAEAIEPAQRSGALEHCVAPAVDLPRGRWDGQRRDMTPEGIGLLVLRGLLIRRVGVGGGFGAELLGQGDLLRPWQGEGAQSTLSPTTGWHVLEPVRIAVLDKRAAVRFARYPELTGRLVAKALERSRNLATAMAIAHHARVELRLHMLFWHLADRWGRVRPDGVSVPLRLTHSILADLVSARRPSVSTCLAELARRDVIQRAGREWLLRGDPPGELLQLQPIRVARGD